MEVKISKTQKLMKNQSMKDLTYSEFLVCLSKDLHKLKPHSNLTQYKSLTNVILKPTFILDERLFITHKVMSKDGIIIRQPLRKSMHYRLYIKSLLNKQIHSSRFASNNDLSPLGNKHTFSNQNKDQVIIVHNKNAVTFSSLQRLDQVQSLFKMNCTTAF